MSLAAWQKPSGDPGVPRQAANDLLEPVIQGSAPRQEIDDFAANGQHPYNSSCGQGKAVIP